VERGLKYLVKSQHKDGYFPKVKGKGKWGVIGHEKVYFTSVSLLAFFSAGYTPDDGEYQEHISRGLGFLLNCCKDSGKITSSQSHTTAQTALATIAFVEAYQKTNNQDLKRRLGARIKQAIRWFRVGRTMGGIWGYTHKDMLSNTGMGYAVMSALIAASEAGFRVDPKIIQRAAKGLRRCTLKDGSLCYEPSELNPQNDKIRRRADKIMKGWRPFRAAAVLFVLHQAGAQDTPEARRIKRFVQKKIKRFLKYKVIMIDPHISYSFLFASFGLKTVFKGRWPRWYTKIKDQIIKRQKRNGSWKHLGRRFASKFEKRLSRCLGTTIAIIALRLSESGLRFIG
jgi:hypothetical protein